MVTITKYVWDSVNDCVMSELDGSGAVQVTYTNEPQQYGEVISQRRGTTTSTYHADALGSTRALIDNSGNITDTYLNDSWGNSVASTGTTVNPFKWVGKYGYYTDNVTGQVYVRARMYMPATSRWTALDPLAVHPNAWSYHYCLNGPITRIDPAGTDFIAVADRRVSWTPPWSAFHYSLQYWRCGCTFQPLCNSDGFSQDEICARCKPFVPPHQTHLLESYSSELYCSKIGSVELLAVTGFSAWGRIDTSGHLFPDPWRIHSVWISVIQYRDTSTRIMPIYSSTMEEVGEKWRLIRELASQYRWAEQGGKDAWSFTGPFRNWPRSMYKSWQTNSNTFVRTIVAQAGIRMCELSFPHPGHMSPSQNIEPGVDFSSIYQPWKDGATPTPKPFGPYY